MSSDTTNLGPPATCANARRPAGQAACGRRTKPSTSRSMRTDFGRPSSSMRFRACRSQRAGGRGEDADREDGAILAETGQKPVLVIVPDSYVLM
jgi:hypothetical protein